VGSSGTVAKVTGILWADIRLWDKKGRFIKSRFIGTVRARTQMLINQSIGIRTRDSWKHIAAELHLRPYRLRDRSSHIKLCHYICVDTLRYSNAGMSKLLETLTVTRREVVASLNCNYQLLISKRKGFVTFWISITESLLIGLSFVM